MNLTLTSYTHIELINSAKVVDDDAVDCKGNPINVCLVVKINQNFQKQAKGLINNGVYNYHRSHVYWQGSCARYNNWLLELNHILKRLFGNNYLKYETSFKELINFTDCNGIIGTEVCQKLAEDFILYFQFIKNNTSRVFYETFYDIMACFKNACNDGVVVFS